MRGSGIRSVKILDDMIQTNSKNLWISEKYLTILNRYYSFGEGSQCYYGYLKRDTLALQIHSGTQMKYYDVLDLPGAGDRGKV